MNTTTKMILGITLAAAAGAAIGMLIAPEKGTDLQKKIKEGASDLMNEFSSLLITGKGLASEFKSKIQPALEEINSEPIELGV
jgi:gas vesicle protein